MAVVVFLYGITGFKKEQPYLADDYNELAGLSISEDNNYEKAVLLYRQAYQLDSQNQYVVYNLAKAYFELKNYSESLHFFQYAVTLDKNDYEAYNFIGIILARMGKPDE
ncbi:tetratricopeptide repeat protein, partial [Arthrospira platensis SPKY1]|nr:tetratricopeptide repeat protein [Arthrospira platensis SPKY1]